jgi:uncharacterized protein
MTMAEGESAGGLVSFLGTGWSFPPEFVMSDRTGGVVMVSDEKDVESSLKILFGTALGERFLNPKYGLDMRELLFEPMSTTMRTFVEDRITTSISIYEPRIDVLSLVVDTTAQQEGRVVLMLEYRIRSTNSRYNLVYPFHATDANELVDALGRR